MTTTQPKLSWQRLMDTGFRLQDKAGVIYAFIGRKSSAWRTKPYGWEVFLHEGRVKGRCKTVCCAKICAKKAVMALLPMTPEERQCYTVIAYAKGRGAAKPTMVKELAYGWILYGTENDATGTPIVWSVAKELGIWSGVGSSGQCQVDLSKLRVP